MKLAIIFVIFSLFIASTYQVCNQHQKSALTDADRKSILDRHNELRNKVALGQETSGSPGPQPKASNMRMMTWDSALEKTAQDYANQCNWGHSGQSGVGENLYGSWSSQTTYNTGTGKTGVDGWYNEVESPGYSNNAVNVFQFSSGTGHYTQVVWANTDKVGCGISQSKDTNGYWFTYMVCQYKQPGNYGGQALYKVGTAASACPSGTKSDGCYSGLCSGRTVTSCSDSSSDESKDTTDDTAVTGYSTDASLACNYKDCANCIASANCDQSAGYFCCPYLKKCVKSGQSCYLPIAQCSGGTCANADYPNKWMKKCGGSGEETEPQPKPACTDNSRYASACPSWAGRGYCTQTYVSFMTTYCKASCNKC